MSTTTAPRKPPRALPPLMRLTDAAAERLRRLYGAGEQGKLLRIGVRTKGCSGLSYDMSWTDTPGPGQLAERGEQRPGVGGGPAGDGLRHQVGRGDTDGAAAGLEPGLGDGAVRAVLHEHLHAVAAHRVVALRGGIEPLGFASMARPSPVIQDYFLI